MMPTIIWITWFIPMLVKAWIDKKKLGINIHEGARKYVSWIVIVAAAILHAIFIADVNAPKNWVPDQYTVAVMLFYPFSWLAFFDAIYNKMIGKVWDFQGTTAATDKLFRKTGGTLYYSVKVFALIVTVVSIVIIYQEYNG